MGKEILTNDINVLIEIINEQAHLINKYKGKIPQIELDIIMANIRRLYEDFVDLNRINTKFRDTQKELSENDVNVLHNQVPYNYLEQNKSEHKEKQNNEVKQEEPIKKQEENRKPINNGKPIDLFEDSENITVADKFSQQKKSVHDKMVQEKKDNSLAESIQKPISDLRTGIGVNDRFLFINELFKGNMSDYIAAVEEINNNIDFDSAMKTIVVLKEKFNWNDKSDSYFRFLVFIKRRFK